MYEREAAGRSVVSSSGFLLLLTFALLIGACGGDGNRSGSAGDEGGGAERTSSVVVRWRESTAADGYIIHWGPASGSYDHELDVGHPMGNDGVLSFVLDGIAAPSTVYIALRSYDVEASLSNFSNELSAFVP